MTLTRDSVIWWVGIAAAVTAGLATLGDAELITKFGIPMWMVPYVRLSALILGIVSGKLATSPLPGKRDL